MKQLILFFASLSLVACPQNPVTPPSDANSDITIVTTPDAPAPAMDSAAPVVIDAAAPVADSAIPDTPTSKACKNLRAIGCKEGAANCETVLGHAASSGLTPIDLNCIAGAVGKAGVRACSGIGPKGCAP